MSSSPYNRILRTISPMGRVAGIAVAALFAGSIVTACDVHDPLGVAALASITVTPDVTLGVNGTQQFVAVGRDASNNIVTIVPTWSVAAGGGTISGTGMFTAGTVPGVYTGTARATVGTLSGSATVTVVAGPLATITVTPSRDTLEVGASRIFTAVGRDASNNIVPITPVWSVVASGGTISTVGLFTAGSVLGEFVNTVRATSGTIFGQASVVVEAASVTPPFIPLGAAQSHGVLAGTEITCITGGIIGADIGISPGNTVTGFGPCVITGVQNLANGVAAQAQLDLTTAYNQLFALPCPPANAIVADLGGTTLAAGVYCSAININVTGALTLNGGGDPDAVFVFQAGTSLVTAGDIILINGAQAKNVYWLTGSSATLGTASQWKGNVIALTSITLVDNAVLLGRALARNGAVSLGTNNVITLP